jgi:AraC-like DNA-binding protein
MPTTRQPDALLAMAPAAKSLHQPPYRDALPAPIVFRTAQMPPQASYPTHRHAWGEFVYSFSGVMEVKLADQHYIAPPQYGIWLPPEVEHRGLNRQQALHSSLYVAAGLCAALPGATCVLTVSPLARALLEHLRLQPPDLPQSLEDQRLLHALVDQLSHARSVGSYLPHSDDPVLGAVLEALERQPGDERSLAEWAAAFHSTERTVSRRCQRDLGMSFAEWRQRLRVVKALPWLQTGAKVETIALDLGYASASAFIAMFRRMTGVTPEEHRRTRRATGCAPLKPSRSA